jgi:hypothetical protein
MSVATSPHSGRIRSRAVAGPSIARCRWYNDGRTRHQFRASLRKPQRGGGKLTGELRRKLDAAQLVIDLHRQRATGTDIRYKLWAAGRFGRDPGRIAKPRVNHNVQRHDVLLSLALLAGDYPPDAACRLGWPARHQMRDARMTCAYSGGDQTRADLW